MEEDLIRLESSDDEGDTTPKKKTTQASRKAAFKTFSYKPTDSVDALMKQSTLAGIEGGEAAPSIFPKKRGIEKTVLKQWYGLSKPEMTDELKNELQVVALKNYLDPKRFFKRGANTNLPEYFEMGEVVAAPTDFYSGRLTKKERKQSIVDEVLSNETYTQYRKKKFGALDKAAKEKGRPQKQKKFRKGRK